MSQAKFDAAAYVAHMETVMAVPVTDEMRPMVIAHMEAIARAGNLIMDFPLGDDVEPAEVFEA